MVLKKDINFTLLAIILGVLIILIGFTVYYQTVFKGLSEKYREKVGNLEKVTQELGLKQTELANKTKVIEKTETSFSSLSEQCGQIQKDKEKLETDNANLQKDLAESKANLIQAQAEVTKKATLLTQAQNDLSAANSRISIIRADLNSCQSNYDSCEAQLDICQG